MFSPLTPNTCFLQMHPVGSKRKFRKIMDKYPNTFVVKGGSLSEI